jgi:hypothetical protein
MLPSANAANEYGEWFGISNLSGIHKTSFENLQIIKVGVPYLQRANLQRANQS